MLSANHSFEKNPQMGNDETHQQFKTQGLRHAPISKQSLNQVSSSQVELDNASNNGGSQVFQDYSEKKSFSKKQKIFIALGVFLAVSMIIGGVVAWKVITSQHNDGPQIPSTYPKYEAQIKTGQEKNLVQLIHVPNSQKIYQYTLVNDQVTVQDATRQTTTKSSVSHKFSLVCLNVTDSSFDILLYFIDTQVKGESEKEISTLTGYPQIKDIQKRFLRNDEESSSDEKKEQIENEYSFLTQKEIEILQSKGISADQFYSSNLPIIRFTMLKNGVISYVQQPLNLRYDIHQIYLNILEQISPIVIKDFYNVSNGKRLLSTSSIKNSYRMLNNEVVQPTYHAEVNQDGKVSTEKSFETLNQRNDNKTRTYNDYTQISNIQNGALQSSKVTSKFSMEDDLVDENDNSQPLFSKLQLNSNCTITFIEQEDIMDESFLNTLIEDQENMTILELTWDQAIAAYNQVFNVSKQTSKAINTEEESHSGRLLQQAKTFGKSVTKPVFRKTYASMEFGADIKSECADSPTANGDICNVGLYSYFNGESIKLLEKNTTINISKVLKIYQYINNIMNDKIFIVQEKVQKSIDAVSVALDDILNKVDYTISIDNNPILRQVKLIVQGDSLNIITQIKQIEALVQTSVNSVNQLLQDPLNTLKNRTLSYLDSKNPTLKQKIVEIQNFYMEKYAKIKEFVDKANQNGGLSSNIQEQIKFLLDHHTQIIVDLIEQPAKDAMDKIQQVILENSDKLFNNATLIDSIINQNITTMVQNLTNNVNLTALNLPFNNIPGFNITEQMATIITQINGNEKIKAAISDAVKQVANNTQLIQQLKDGLKQTLDTTKNTVIAQLQIMKNSSNTNPDDQKRIDDIKAELTSIIGFGSDIYQDIIELKKNITDITENIKNIKASDVKDVAIQLSSALLNLPVDMAIKIKDDALKTAEQIKQIGIQVYKDMKLWKDDLAQDSQILLTQAEAVYADVLAFLTQKQFPEDDPKFYQKPLYDDIQSTISGVKNLMNMKFVNITDKYQKVKDIPAKFQKFVIDLKALYQSTLSFANEIKITIFNAKIDSGLIGQYITKFISNTKKQSEQVVIEQVESSINKPVALQAASALALQADQFINVDLLNTYNQIVSGQEVDVKKIYKQLIADLVANANFQQDFKFPNINIPIEYIYIYPTPIGVAIKLKLSAAWNTGIGMNFAFKNATLDFAASVNTKVIVTGEVSASILVAEVGGYAQGTFLDTTVTAGIHLEVMNDYKGNYYFDGSFNPFEVKVGLYYQYYFPSEITKCGGNIQLTPEELAHQTDDVKKSVQTTTTSWVKSIFSKVSSAVNCLKALKITPTRKDLFEPLAVKGETYSKRLAEGTF